MNKRRRYRKLTDIRVDEISCMDKSAGVGTRIMLRKSATAKRDAAFAAATRCLAMSVKSIAEDSSCDKNNMLTKTFSQFQQHLDTLMKRYRKNLDISVGEAGPDEGFENPDERDDDDDNGSTPRFHAGSPDDDETTEASDGIEQAEQELDDDNDEKEQTMKSQLMSDVVKRYGITAFCKSVEKGDVSVSEHALCKLIEEAANRENTSFSKLFEAQDERGIVLRKAIMAARDAQFVSRTSTMSKAAAGMPGRATLTPRVTGGRAARAVDNPKSALAELQALVDEQRAQNPALSESAAWLAVYTHPDNVELAQRERAENRPTAAW
jgi:hypothetical protein